MMSAAMKLRHASWNKSYRQNIKKQRHQFANKGLYRQNYDFSSSHANVSFGAQRKLSTK